WNTMREIINKHGNEKVHIEFLRDKKIMHTIVTPEVQYSDGVSVAFLGVMSAWSDYPKNLIYKQRYSFFNATKHALDKTWELIALSYNMIGKMIIGQVPLKSLTGPIGIAQGTAASATIGFIYYIEFLALISVSLGVINTLPIPVLDGGHLLYYIIELIRGKPVTLRTKETGVWIGLALILILTFIAFFNDFMRILS
ncbi:MAG: RIP metalloprotease RseP, partial [Gammaproteobacteria bacterium]